MKVIKNDVKIKTIGIRISKSISTITNAGRNFYLGWPKIRIGKLSACHNQIYYDWHRLNVLTCSCLDVWMFECMLCVALAQIALSIPKVWISPYLSDVIYEQPLRPGLNLTLAPSLISFYYFLLRPFYIFTKVLTPLSATCVTSFMNA